jgi:hypothetical protein
MSEQDKPKNYMQQLDEWTDATIVLPLYAAFAKDSESVYEEAVLMVKKAIREKVLESYHNGKAAQAPRAYKRPGYAKR